MLRAAAWVSAFLSSFLLLTIRPASAGQDYGMGFSCATSAGDRVCYGSLRAARLSAGATDFAEFRLDGTGYLYFSASWSGTRYACGFDPQTSAHLGPAAMGGDYNLYFSIRMDAQGNCRSNSYFMNSSSYQSLAKP